MSGYLDMEQFEVICMGLQFPLNGLMQAALTRIVVFDYFETNQQLFATHPANCSLTWAALEAYEDKCVVHLVEELRNSLYKPHVPPSVSEKVEALVGHRHVVSHPFTRGDAWDQRRMKQFDREGRRYESRVPLAWNLHAAICAELSSAGLQPIPIFVVTPEMAHMAQHVLTACIKPDNTQLVPSISELSAGLRDYRDKILRICADRAANAR